MEKRPGLKAGIRKSIGQKREEIDLTQVSLTASNYLQPGQLLPLVIQPTMDGVNLASWAANNRDVIHTELAKHGGILFHNFTVDSPAKFEAFARAISGELFDEYGDLPRENRDAIPSGLCLEQIEHTMKRCVERVRYLHRHSHCAPLRLG